MKKTFWRKFEDLMDAIPDYIDDQFGKISGGSSTSTIIMNNKKIVVKATGKKMTITVNGKQVYSE